MLLLTALEHAWMDVEQAHKGGYLKNQSMLAFAWWKAMHKLALNLHVTYAACSFSTETDWTNVVIWQDQEPPSVLFAGELVFFPDSIVVIESVAAKLRHANQSRTLAAPERDPQSGEIVRQQMAKSNSFALGLFIVAPRESVAVMHTHVMQGLAESGRTIFHLGFGAVADDPALEPVFQYVPPWRMP